MNGDRPTVGAAQTALDDANAAVRAAIAAQADAATLAELYEVAENARHVLYLAGEAAKTVHVRKRPGLSLGRPGYSHATIAARTGGYHDPAADTLCGEQAQTVDLSWADTRSQRSLAYVTCEACRTARAAAQTR